jgi:hypothetical protein
MAMETRLEADLRSLPPPAMASQAFAFYNAHAVWLDNDDLVCQNKQIGRWRVENDSYGFVWNLLAEAQDRSKPLIERQNAIANLKEELRRPYCRGQMPLPPIKRFKEGRPSKQQMDFLSLILETQSVGYVY